MKRLFVWVLIGGLLAGCAVKQNVRVKDGKEYGVVEGAFRARWWNYYERGMSYAEGGFYGEAQADFDLAIRKRRDDRWRARSYGMHFVNYFPHRELGIVYLRQEKIDDAIRELETSLGTAESAKAKYFLNQAREKQLRKTGLDRLPPVLNIASGAESNLTNAFTLTVAGLAEDDRYVASVRVQEMPVFLELSTRRFPFEKEVNLDEGQNRIVVVAVDLTGKETKETIEITADHRGPVISIGEIRKTTGGTRVVGHVSDPSGVRRVELNGKALDGGVKEAWDFDETVTEDLLRLRARDRAGNETRAEIPLVKKASIDKRWTRMAGLAPDLPPGVPDLETRSPTDATEEVTLALSLGGLLDTVPPEIAFEDWTDAQEVFEEEVLIEGSVTDNKSVASLKADGEEILRKEGSRVYFSHLVRLKEGENRFLVEASDSRGNKARRELRVTRKLSRVRQIGSRLRVALLPMERKGESSVAGNAVYDSLLASFVEQGRFGVIERKKMDALLRELKLSGTDLVDPKSAVRTGRLAAADLSLAGTIVESTASLEIVARIIDTETSEVLSANDVFDEAKDLSAVRRLMDILSYKFKRDLPLVEGLIIEVDGTEIMVDVGTEKRIRKNARLIVYRDGPTIRHPVTGRILGSDTKELGEARVRECFDAYSKAALTRKDGEVETMARVITK